MAKSSSRNLVRILYRKGRLSWPTLCQTLRCRQSKTTMYPRWFTTIFTLQIWTFSINHKEIRRWSKIRIKCLLNLVMPMQTASLTKTSLQLSKTGKLGERRVTGARAKISLRCFLSRICKIHWFPRDIKIPWCNRSQPGINLKSEWIKGRPPLPSP